MSFLEPLRLLLLIGVGALAAAYIGLSLTRRSQALKFTNLDLLASVAPRRPGWRRHVPAAICLLGISLAVVGFAEPARTEQVPREQATVVLAIDTSLSMEATDVAPSRLEAAQAAASEFLEVAPAWLEISLVSFDGVAVVRVAPTTDRRAVQTAVDDLRLGEGTAVGEAIFASLAAIEAPRAPESGGDPQAPPARIVVMSDGTTTVGRPNSAGAAAAKEAGIEVSTVGFGTDAGVIPNPQGIGLVPVPVDDAALEAIAIETGGTYHSAASASELSGVYEDIGSTIAHVSEQRDVSMVFVGAGVAALMAAVGLSLLWINRVV